MQPLISVIMPVYGAEEYLGDCIESITKQTYTNLQILLVDDGSPDRCGEICDEWAAKDERIRVIHKKNGGKSDACNVGVAAATGDYMVLTDCDDLLDPKMYEILMRTIEQEQSDMVCCDLKRFSHKADIVSEADKPFTPHTVDAEHALLEMMTSKIFDQIINTKLMKAYIPRQEPLPVGTYNEDDFWTYRAIGAAKKLTYVDVPLYYYYQREGSLMHLKYSLRRASAVDAYEARVAYVRERFPRLEAYALQTYVSVCMFHYQMVCLTPDIDEDGAFRAKIEKRMRDFTTDERRMILSVLSKKQQMWVKLFLKHPRQTARLRNCFKIGF